MPIVRVDDFKARLSGGGARPNLFDVLVSYPAFAGGDPETTSFMCKATSLPASTQGTINVDFRGRQVKIAGDRTFDDWTMTVYNDTNFTVRDAMERWMNGINAHSENSGLTSPADYQSDMLVRQLDKDGSVLKAYNFRGAFPINIAEVALDYGTNDVIEEYDITFAYQYWTADTVS